MLHIMCVHLVVYAQHDLKQSCTVACIARIREAAVLLAEFACVMFRNSFLTCAGCEQDNQSGDEADASQPSQTQQLSADESQQPQLASAYREPKKAWKKIQRTGHLAPAPGAADLTVEHNFSDEISIDSLK